MIKFFPGIQNSRVNGLLEHLRIPLFRNGYALIVSTVITSLLGLVYWAMAARIYRTDSVGLNSTAISAMFFLSGIAQINLQETMIRFIPQAGKRTLRLVLATYGIIIGLSVVVGLIFCLGIATWSPALSFLTVSPTSIAWFVFALVLWSIFVIQDSVLIGLRQALWIPFENAIFSVIKILLLLLLAVTIPENGIFSSWALALLAVVLPINYLIFRHLIPQYVRKAKHEGENSLRAISKYVMGNYIAALLANMATALMPILIVQLAGATASAHFYLAWIIASSLQIVTANMATSMTVEGALSQDRLEEHRRRTMIGIARIVIPLGIILILGAPLILQAMGPGYKENAMVLMQLLAVAAVPNIYNMVFVGLARVQNRAGRVVFVYGANAVMVLGLSMLLLPYYGITGVGIAWVVSQTTIAIFLNLFGDIPVAQPAPLTELEKDF